jgi:hypothetical protein
MVRSSTLNVMNLCTGGSRSASSSSFITPGSSTGLPPIANPDCGTAAAPMDGPFGRAAAFATYAGATSGGVPPPKSPSRLRPGEAVPDSPPNPPFFSSHMSSEIKFPMLGLRAKPPGAVTGGVSVPPMSIKLSPPVTAPTVAGAPMASKSVAVDNKSRACSFLFSSNSNVSCAARARVDGGGG